MIIAFLLLAAGGLYAILSGSGNLQTAANQTTDENRCAFALEHGRTINAAATGDVAAFRPLESPLDMTEISFLDKDGAPKTLGDWLGKTVLFNLWATWCPPCREEMPYFETLQTEKGGDEFEVVPVSIDLGNAAKPKKFYADAGLKALPFFQDNTMEAFQSLKRKAVALGMPTTILIDRNGCGLGVLNGPAHWASPDAKRLIDAALALPKQG